MNTETSRKWDALSRRFDFLTFADDRRFGHLPDSLGERNKEALFGKLVASSASQAAGHVDHVYPGFNQVFGRLLAVLGSKPARNEVVAADAVEKRVVVAVRLLDGRDNLTSEGQTPTHIAAVAVLSAVSERRKELAKEIAVGAVNLDDIEAGLSRPPCRFGIGGDQFGDLIFREAA